VQDTESDPQNFGKTSQTTELQFWEPRAKIPFIEVFFSETSIVLVVGFQAMNCHFEHFVISSPGTKIQLPLEDSFIKLDHK
jgi:hypothetical protein